MKKTFYLALLWSAFFVGAFAQANIKLTETTLMHEMRATPYPKDKAVVDDRYVSFQWPLRADANVTSEVLDGMERKTKVDKSKLKYRLRYSQDASFAKGTKEVETIWPFYNPDTPLTSGTWYWQYGYVNEAGQVEWKSTQELTVGARKN